MSERDCKHGQQARVCPLCEADIRIDELHAQMCEDAATIKALREALSTALAMKDSALRRAMAAEKPI
jgi:hypothetical protein